MESMQIVDSMSDDGKSAYMLRKQANESMSAYNELYGYYQMAKALDMSTKGKVKTDSQSNFLDEELKELELFRRKGNRVEFEGLEELMSKKNIRNIARKAGIDLKNIEIEIIKDKKLINSNYFGYAPPEGNKIVFYPDAFKNTESLVKTMRHEGIHVLQVRKYGVPTNTSILQSLKNVARRSETIWWEYYKTKNGVK